MAEILNEAVSLLSESAEHPESNVITDKIILSFFKLINKITPMSIRKNQNMTGYNLLYAVIYNSILPG